MEGDTLESLSRLSIDLLEFLYKEDYQRLLNIADSFPEYYCRENQFDVIVKIDGEDCYCNSDILSSRSSYFRTALSHDYVVKKGSYIILEEPSISPDTFKTMLKFFYRGGINLNNLDGELCISLLKAAEHFRLEELIEELQRHIIHNKTTWLQFNFIRVINGVFVEDGDERIRHHLIHKVNDNPWYLLKSDELKILKSSCFISVMDDECFYVNQGTVWDILIRWGIQQSPTLRLGVPNWTYEDWMTLKEAIKELIPHIKFSKVSRNDYYGKILPYNKVLSTKEQNLNDEVLLCYLDKDVLTSNSKLLRQVFLDDSSIINHFHANIILQWITEGVQRYTIRLPLLVDMLQETGEPLIEKTIQCKMRKDRDIESEYIPYLWVGPRFGAKDLAIDLHKMKATSIPQYYDKPIHDVKEFNVDDVEVFQVVEY
ncbi:unnamed protein product [Rhizophagus irregularis]|nr:unnamed protein product [Rhizophagus irregularis]CAB5141576.1 unnamed protein product [Rhizophagus irregularis]